MQCLTVPVTAALAYLEGWLNMQMRDWTYTRQQKLTKLLLIGPWYTI